MDRHRCDDIDAKALRDAIRRCHADPYFCARFVAACRKQQETRKDDGGKVDRMTGRSGLRRGEGDKQMKRVMVDVCFGDADVSTAATKLTNAGYEVHRLPQKCRPYLFCAAWYS
jgi:hypothetical protein